MRDAINNAEGQLLVDAMKRGATWAEARLMLPGVDPAALDRGWKAWVHREAGFALPEATPTKAKK